MKFFIFFLLFSFSSFAQNEYDSLICEAKILVNENKKEKAIDYYLKAFEYQPCKRYDYFAAFKISIETKPDSTINRLMLLSVNSGYSFESIQSVDLKEFIKSNYWIDFNKNKDSIYNAYNSRLDKVWITEINKMFDIEQKVRFVYMKSFKDSVRKSKVLFSMNLIDSLNFDGILKLSKERGFPSIKSIGEKSFEDLFILLWHHRGKEFYENPNWINLKAYIDIEIKNNTIPKSFYVPFEDDYRLTINNSMYFGSLYASYSGRPEFNTLTVENKYELNKRRKEIGLCSIELWLKSLSLPIPEKLK